MRKSYREFAPGQLNTPWDVAHRQILKRKDSMGGTDCEMERGVNFFIKTIESLGGTTFFSCEGHDAPRNPDTFYVMFSLPLDKTILLANASDGLARIELVCNEHHPESKWVIRLVGCGFSYQWRTAYLRELSVNWAKIKSTP